MLLVNMDGIYESMLFNEKTADTVFKAGTKKERIPAHAAVLAEACEPFQRMFFGNLTREDEIHVPDCEPDAFKVFLRHIYIGTLESTDTNVVGVAFVAKKYVVAKTYSGAVSFLIQGLTKERVCELLKFLPSLGLLEEVNEKFWEMLNCETEAILNSPQFLDVDYATLKEIVGRDTINASETTIYSRAVEWAKKGLRRNIALVSDHTVRDLLGEVLYLIRFPLMTVDEFSHGPAKDGVLTSDEKVDVFLSITTGSASARFSRISRLMQQMFSCPLCGYKQAIDADATIGFCDRCGKWFRIDSRKSYNAVYTFT